MTKTEEQLPSEACDLLVLGASFTGVEVLYQLRRMGALASIDTVVVDAQTEHAYIPLIHELVVGVSTPASYLLRTEEYVSSLPRTRYIQDTVLSLDAHKRVARLASGRLLRARAIVIALGSTLKTPQKLTKESEPCRAKFLSESLELRKRLLASPPGRLVVVGGGITGVEMAAELAEWAKHQQASFSVSLVHADDQLLSHSGPGVGSLAFRLLCSLGVDVLLEARVEALESDHIVLSESESPAMADGSSRRLDCVLVVWAGGIQPTATTNALDVYRASDGWIEVDPWLRCVDAKQEVIPGVFAGGDAVRVREGSRRWPTMQRAIECIFQGKVLARNLAAELRLSAGKAPGHPMGLTRHRLVRDFPYGISIGRHSLVMVRGWAVNLRALGVAFRRWLMRRYFARYAPLKGRQRPGP